MVVLRSVGSVDGMTADFSHLPYEFLGHIGELVSIEQQMHKGMTADFSHLPYEFLGHISSEIINQVKGVNRVVYDISSKPPSTIEWE